MSAAQISALPVSQYARLTGREFKITAEPEPEPALVSPPGQDPAGVIAAQHPEHAAEDPGTDFQALTMRQYSQIRGQLGIGQSRQEGVGIMNQSGSSWADAARRQPGRSSWQGANVVEPPRLEGRQERRGDMRDYRSASARFSTPGNSFQI
jgi:hypothetical protein